MFIAVMRMLKPSLLAAAFGVAASIVVMPALGGPTAIVELTFTGGAEFGVPPPRLARLGRLDLDSGALTMAPCPPTCLGAAPFFDGAVAKSDINGSYVLFNEGGARLRRISASTAAVLETTLLETPSFTMSRLPFDDVFVSGTWSGSHVDWIDGRSMQRVGSVAVSSSDVGSSPALSVDGAHLFVSAGSRLVKIDAKSRSIVASRDVGFEFVPVVDRRTGRIYGVDRDRMRAIGFDPQTLDVVFDMPVEEEDSGDPNGALAVDHRGRLWIEVDSSRGARRVTILDPSVGRQTGDMVLSGQSFVAGYRSDRILRVGQGSSCVAGPYSCGGDALFEYDAESRFLLRTTPLEFRTPAEVQSTSRVVLVWMAFLPDTGTAVEFHHAGLDHYFLSADEGEVDALDRGAFAGWQRTGQSFEALRSDMGPEGYIPVCRYYGRPERGLDSHFYSASDDECLGLGSRYDGAWVLERRDAFYAAPADASTGACPGDTRPVYRLWNARFDSNHRYTTSAAIKAEMVARGYVPEGYGPDDVAFCVRNASD